MLVTGLDKSLPVDKMSQQLNYIFSQLLPGDKVIQCRAVGRFDSTLEKAKLLREYKRKYRYYKRINAIGEEEAKKLQIPYLRIVKKERLWWCSKPIEHDAQDHYKAKIIYISDLIKDERQ